MYDDKNQGQENRQVNTYDPDQLYKGNARKKGFQQLEERPDHFLIIAVAIVILASAATWVSTICSVRQKMTMTITAIT